MKIKEVIDYLEQFAPPDYQEAYDNSGLLVGDKNADVTKVMLCLDSTEEVVADAIQRKCNLIIAHHPINFRGLKRITGSNYAERAVLKAIKNDIAIYAIHTNLDNVINGVNGKIADKLKLNNRRVLIPKKDVLNKIEVYVPDTHKEKVKMAMFKAGAGAIGNYSECSFDVNGKGNFLPMEGSNPFKGEKGKRQSEDEVKMELIAGAHITTKAVSAMIAAHPYEAVAYQIVKIENIRNDVGSGIIGELQKETDALEFLKELKKVMNLTVLKHTNSKRKKIRKVAIMGGAGAFGISAAKQQQADIYITGDIKYHDFFDGENQLILVDIGHYESEHFTMELLADRLKENFPKFALLFTKVNTNPVKYL